MQRLLEFIGSLKSYVANAFALIPFFGSLPKTSSRDRREAFWELLLSQIVSFMPVWLGVIIFAWPQLVNADKLLGGFRYMVQTGELFIYAASTLAPVIYIVTRDRDVPRVFPHKNWYIALVLFGAIASAAIFALQRTSTQQLDEATITLSLWIFVCSLALLYFALVYNNTYLPNPGAAMRKEEDQYTQGLRDRH